MNAVTFHVPGKPQGKARAKTVRNKHTGNTMSYTPETDLLYENYIKDRFLNKCNGMFLERGKPVTLRIVARFLPPKSTSKKRTALMLDGKELPLKKPDIDNIVKVVADALNGVAYHDDTQIVMVVAKKVYSSLEVIEYLTSVLRGESTAQEIVVEGTGDGCSEARTMEKSPSEKERLKAAELLGKRYALFTDKVETDVDMDLNITIDYGEDDTG